MLRWKRVVRFAPVALFALLALTTAMSAAAAPAPEVSSSPSVPPIGLTPITVATPVVRLAFVPDCSLLLQTACENALVSRGLRLGTISFLAPAGPPPYVGSHVVAQSPAAGALVVRGSSVNITLQPFGLPGRF